jgi:hypothetical protein
MNLLDNITCRKCGQEKEFSYQILCQCTPLAGHRTKIFSSAWLGLLYIKRASVKQVQALALRIGLFCRALVKTWPHNWPNSSLSWGDKMFFPRKVNIYYLIVILWHEQYSYSEVSNDRLKWRLTLPRTRFINFKPASPTVNIIYLCVWQLLTSLMSYIHILG